MSSFGRESVVPSSNQQSDPAPRGQVAVHAWQLLAPGVGVRLLGVRRVPLPQLGAVHLPAHHHPVGLHPGGRGEATAVLGHPLGLVVGEDAQVERAVRALAHSPFAR